MEHLGCLDLKHAHMIMVDHKYAHLMIWPQLDHGPLNDMNGLNDDAVDMMNNTECIVEERSHNTDFT